MVEIVGLERGSGPEALTCSMASVVSRPEGLRSRIALALPVGLVPEIAFLFLTGFVTHIIARHVLRPVSFWFRNLLARIKHNAIGLLGVASIGFAGHIIHVALPASRGLRAGWMRLLTITPTPLGLKPLLSGNWAQYAVHPDRPGHLFGHLKHLD